MKNKVFSFIFVQAVGEKEASTMVSMGIGTQILSRLMNVRMSVREVESGNPY